MPVFTDLSAGDVSFVAQPRTEVAHGLRVTFKAHGGAPIGTNIVEGGFDHRIDRSTIVDVDLAIGSRKAGGASTGVTVDSIFADAPILAGGAGTIIDIVLTIVSAEPRRTATGVRVDTIGARAPVLTGVRGAIINIDFAI